MKPLEIDPLKTRISLIDRIRNLQNDEAWYEFVRIYRPLVVRFSLSWKVSAADAEDIAQNTLAWVADRIKDYEYRPATCPFRAWLLQKVRHLIQDRFREIGRRGRVHVSEEDVEGDSSHPPLEQLPDPKSLEWEDRWETEHQRALFDAASQAVRRQVGLKHFQAFDMCNVQGQPVEVVAQKLDVTTSFIHTATHRIRSKLKAEMARLQKQYE
jgi:RNA polymerase sigma factor (sigma-70 family)